MRGPNHTHTPTPDDRRDEDPEDTFEPQNVATPRRTTRRQFIKALAALVAADLEAYPGRRA